MSGQILIYGASGFTGRLVAQRARDLGSSPIVAGRNAATVVPLATELKLDHRVAPLDDPSAIDDMLAGVSVLVNTAGPFRETAVPLAEACIRSGCHYLDVSGEYDSIEAVSRRHGLALQKDVMLMPAVGFDVVATDCLAALVASARPGARRLHLAISGLTYVSRGSARTAMSHILQASVGVRRDGQIRFIPPASLERVFDFGAGPSPCIAVSWGDVATAYFTTGIPDTTVFFEANPLNRFMMTHARLYGPALNNPLSRAWADAFTRLLPEGPTAEQQANHRITVVAEAESDGAPSARARLKTPDAYTFTGHSSIAAARRVLGGDLQPGFQTPARVFGSNFALQLAGVEREAC